MLLAWVIQLKEVGIYKDEYNSNNYSYLSTKLIFVHVFSSTPKTGEKIDDWS